MGHFSDYNGRVDHSMEMGNMRGMREDSLKLKDGGKTASAHYERFKEITRKIIGILQTNIHQRLVNFSNRILKFYHIAGNRNRQVSELGK